MKGRMRAWRLKLAEGFMAEDPCDQFPVAFSTTDVCRQAGHARENGRGDTATQHFEEVVLLNNLPLGNQKAPVGR